MLSRQRVWRALAITITLFSTIIPGKAQQSGAQPRFDLTKAEQISQWKPAHDIARLGYSPQGMMIEASGDDPYIYGPARNYSPDQNLWLRVRLKSEQAGTAQVFYYTASRGTNEADSVRFSVPGGKWVELRVPMPPLRSETYLRFDPPGGKGNKTILALLAFEPRAIYTAPEWPRPFAPALQGDPLTVTSGELELRHARSEFGGFEARVAGEVMAVGQSRPLIGVLRKGTPHWIAIAERGITDCLPEGGALMVRTRVTDDDGSLWTIRQKFAPAAQPNAIEVSTEIYVNREQQVLFLPILLLHPGFGSFGEKKNQAVFAGLEYLDRDEPSSSEADIIGPGARRQVPDTAKITFPLMAIQTDGRYIGLSWEPNPSLCAVFDSPDRLFRSGAHLMGVLFPGSDGSNREEGSLLPYEAVRLEPTQLLRFKATLLGGKGESIVPAVQQYVGLRGLPALPKTLGAQGYFDQATAGWLDSGIKVGNRYRHAYPGNFAPQPAADAALMMEWLATRTRDKKQAMRLREAAQQALTEVPPSQYDFAAVGHVRTPAVALAYGHTLAGLNGFLEQGRGVLKRFEPDGSVLYRKSPEGLDYGRTHFAPDANGLAAPLVTQVLEAATRTADPHLRSEGLRLLRALNKFRHTVPRGAQTWEVPLHTPDILASAYLVRAYTLGFEWTGERALLDEAIYWAWTGVPFVYLTPPTSLPVGIYSTTPVFGATQWVAPNWMGLPVQWCGLVYSDALYRLVRHHPEGPWKQIADGITRAGIQHNWPVRLDPKRQGLLPDSLTLRTQVRNDVAINPATVQANAVRLFGKSVTSTLPTLYDYVVFRLNGLAAHAPGPISNTRESLTKVTFTVEGWPAGAYEILVTGFQKEPKVRLSGSAPATHTYHPEQGALILRAQGIIAVEITP